MRVPLSIALLTACAAPPLEPEPPTSPALVHVSPAGDDDGPGTRERPFKTLDRALASGAATIFLRAGRYEAPGFDRPVRLIGEGRSVTIVGWVHARAPLGLESLDLEGAAAGSLELRDLVMTSSAGLVLDGPASLTDVTVHTTGARAVRLRSGAATVTRLTVRGSTIAQLQLDPTTTLVAADLDLSDGGGAGLVALHDSTLEIDRGAIRGMRTIGLTLDRARADLSALRFGPNDDLSIGVLGATATITNSTVEASRLGVVSVVNHRARTAALTLRGGTIEHGPQSAITAGGGHLRLLDVRLVGAPVDAEDAVVARGPATHVDVAGATFDAPAGFALGVYDHATASIRDTTIRNPHAGGIFAESSPRLRVESSTVTGGRSSSGIAVFGGSATLDDLTITECAEAGLLANDGARVELRRSHLANNRQYGVAVFGATALGLSDTLIRGSPLATFAACGATLDDRGGNQIEGPRSECR